jgi:hypothetical protein
MASRKPPSSDQGSPACPGPPGERSGVGRSKHLLRAKMPIMVAYNSWISWRLCVRFT